MLASLALGQASGERELVIHALTLSYRAPKDEAHPSFAVNSDYELVPSFSTDGLLIKVSIDPKPSRGPRWVQLSRVEFESLLATINSIKPIGVFEEEAGGNARSAYVHIERRYSEAYLLTEEVSENRQFRAMESAAIYYLHAVNGALNIRRGESLDTADSFGLVCVDGKLYKAPKDELIKLVSTPNERQTVQLAGPMYEACSPDQALHDKAVSALAFKRRDVANLTLQTLINTYPDSEYTPEAKLLMKDPEVAKCAGWMNPRDCSGDPAESLSAH